MSTITFKLGGQDVRKPVPYPVHVDTETGIMRWGSEELQFLGIQNHIAHMTIDIWPEEVFYIPTGALGKHIVYMNDKEDFFTITEQITGGIE